jgi:hypothetical protein
MVILKDCSKGFQNNWNVKADDDIYIYGKVVDILTFCLIIENGVTVFLASVHDCIWSR